MLAAASNATVRGGRARPRSGWIKRPLTFLSTTAITAPFAIPPVNAGVSVSVASTADIDINSPSVSVGPYALNLLSIDSPTQVTLQNLTAAQAGNIIHTPAILVFNSVAVARNFQTGLFQRASFYNGAFSSSLLSSQGGRQFAIQIDKWSVSEITPATGRNSGRLQMGWWCQAEQYAIYQDNQSAAIIFDGSTSRRANPAASEVPVGNVMCYAMGRLLVALPDRQSYRAGNLVFENSGTTYDLLQFSDNNYLNEGGDFVARVFGAPSNVGPILAMRGVAMEDTQLGQGPVIIGQPNMVFTVNLPFDRTTWKNLSNALQTANPIKGPLGQDSTILINTDIWYRALDGIRSYMMARREFRERWGNSPMSNEVNSILAYDTTQLLEHGSAVLFDNRLLMTVSPVQSIRGVWFRGLAVIDFNELSSLRGKNPPCWEGIWAKERIFQTVVGTVNNNDRCFAYTLNDSNQIELWEIIPDLKFDNETDAIPWTLDFPSYNCGDSDRFKALESARMVLQDISGTLTYNLKYRSDQNPCWRPWANSGVCSPNQTCNPADCTGPLNLRDEQRSPIKFPRPADDFDSSSNNRKWRTGYQFQPRLEFNGYGELKQFRIYCVDQPEDNNALRPAALFKNAEQTVTVSCTPPATGSNTATIAAGTYTSYCSQDDADAQAYAAAVAKAKAGLSCTPQAQLDGLLWLLPCLSDASSTSCVCADNYSTSAKLEGAAGVYYDITLRIRGVVELKDYVGGTVIGGTNNNLNLGGTPQPADPYNIYSLAISSASPSFALTYYLNNWDSGQVSNHSYCKAVDYTFTVLNVPAGSKFLLNANSGGDQNEIKNIDHLGNPITITPGPGDPPINPVVNQPFGGQWLQVDVVSVVQH